MTVILPFIKSLYQQSVSVLQRVRKSQFAGDAALLMIFNLFSRAVGFFGSTYAARCLGPVNLGTSSLIQSTAQQGTLAYDGGFSFSGIRRIAADKGNSQEVIETIISFHLYMALIAVVFWLIGVYWLAPEYQRFAWMFGVFGLIYFATNIVFVFQGLEKLPVQTIINTVGSLLTAGAYFVFFKPGMFLGADLVVASVVGFIVTVLAWGAYYRMFGHFPIGKLQWRLLVGLLRESWRYWISTVFIGGFEFLQIPLLVYFMGTHDAGIYRAAITLAVVPDLLFSSINALLLARLVVWRKQSLQYMWRRQSQLAFLYTLVGGTLTVFLVLVMPFAARHLLGPAFQNSISVFQILSIARLGVFIGQIYAYGLISTGMDKSFQWITGISTVIGLPFMILFISLLGIIGAAIAVLFCQTLAHILCYFSLRAYVVANN